jgi:hypothetical protein
MPEEQGVLEVNASFKAEPWGVLTYFQNSLTSSKVLSSIKE